MVGAEVIGSSAFNLSALVISVTCIVYKLIIRGKVKLKNWLFIAFILIIAIDSLSGIVEQFLVYSKLTFETKLLIGHANLFVYFLTHFAMVPVFVYYIYITFVPALIIYILFSACQTKKRKKTFFSTGFQNPADYLSGRTRGSAQA